MKLHLSTGCGLVVGKSLVSLAILVEEPFRSSTVYRPISRPLLKNLPKPRSPNYLFERGHSVIKQNYCTDDGLGNSGQSISFGEAGK